MKMEAGISMDLTVIEKSGFRYGEEGEHPFGAAFFSLRIAIRSWFCTYSPERYPGYAVTWKDSGASASQTESREYCELAAQTIIHAHHFCELIIKDVLRRQHPLLADKAGSKDVVLYKLLNNIELDDEETSELGSIGFSEAKKRLISLEKVLDSESVVAVLMKKESLSLFDTLNKLRNRMMHRGLYVLEREALDVLMAKYFLPLVLSIDKSEPYQGNKAHWKYNSLDCEIDPIECLVEEFNKSEQNSAKTCFLKELGRAAYFSPLHVPLKERKPGFKGTVGQDLDDRNLYQWMSDKSGLKQCPVCGLNSIEFDRETDSYDDDEKGVQINEYWVSDIQCKCCGFHLKESIGNPEGFDMQGFDSWFWKTTHFKEIEKL